MSRCPRLPPIKAGWDRPCAAYRRIILITGTAVRFRRFWNGWNIAGIPSISNPSDSLTKSKRRLRTRRSNGKSSATHMKPLWMKKPLNGCRSFAVTSAVRQKREKLGAKRRQLTQAQRRIEELDRLFKRIYEDNISGKINDSRFQKLFVDYENEQAELTQKVHILEQEIAKQQEEADSIEQFIRRAKKYPELTELTPAVLHDLVNKVYVCAPDRSSGHRVQDVRISLACIGFLPESIISEMVNHTQENRTA